jgi:hypothetical protein
MTADRIRAVAALGFTDRQAAFLVTVMLHSGVCLARQYCAFTGLVHGQKTRDFFSQLVSRGYATACECSRRDARLYHVQHKTLYRSIGETDSRFRRPTPIGRAVERLMLLDAVLGSRDLTWLATERDKLAHFTLTTRLSREELPRLVFRGATGETVRYFPDKLPIGIQADGQRHIWLYLVTRAAPVDFRAFLQRQAELLRALPEWTIRLVMPRHLAAAEQAYRTAIQEELATPLRPAVVEELRWYFHQQRARNGAPTPPADPRFRRAHGAFAAPRFSALYRRWLEAGEPVLDAQISNVLADALERRNGQVECHVLPHQYLHLAPLAGTV